MLLSQCLSPTEGKSVGSCAVTYKPDQLPPENSSFLERSFVCRFRCLLDNSSGFLVSTGSCCDFHSRRGVGSPQGCHCWITEFGFEGPGTPFCLMQCLPVSITRYFCCFSQALYLQLHHVGFVPLLRDAESQTKVLFLHTFC